MKKKNLFIALLVAGLVLVSCEDGDFVVNSASVTYLNYDGSVLYTTILGSDGDSSYQGTEPTKPATIDNSYKFTGWSDPVIDISNNKVYKAEFDTMATVTFKNYDATTLYSTTIKQGETAVYSGANPTKPTTNNKNYTFTGWSIDLKNIQKNCETTAQFKETNTYAIKFVNYDNTVLQSSRFAEGDLPVYSGATPTKPEETGGTYEFSGWSPDLVVATSDATYIAQFKFNANPTEPETNTEATINYEYSSYRKGYSVMSFFQDGTNVNVKDTYNDGVNGEQPVVYVRICNNQSGSIYKNNSSSDIKQIVNIPASVTEIENSYSFDITEINVDSHNSNYESIDGVLYTKDGTELVAFPSGVTGDFVISDEVTMLDTTSFTCTSLSAIKIGKNVSKVAYHAFTPCVSLKSFYVDDDNKDYTAIEGVLFSKDGNNLVVYPPAKSDKSYVIPQGVKTIYSGAFCGWTTELESLTLDDELEELDSDSLDGLRVESLNIPKNVQIMDGRALSDVYTKSYTVDSDNKYFTAIDGDIYSYDKKKLIAIPRSKAITEYSILDGVEIVGQEALVSDSLIQINIPKSVTTFELWSFCTCMYLRNLYIPINVTTIKDQLFLFMFDCGLVIYCEAASKPSGWMDNWNSGNFEVNWGSEDPNL